MTATPPPDALQLESDVLTPEEAALVLKVEIKTLYAAIEAGTVPFRRISPKRVRFSRTGLKKWLESATPTAEATE